MMTEVMTCDFQDKVIKGITVSLLVYSERSQLPCHVDTQVPKGLDPDGKELGLFTNSQ